MQSQLSFRGKSKNILTSSAFVVSTIIGSIILMSFIDGRGFLLGLFVALVTFWAVQWDWSYFGIGNVEWSRTLRGALAYTILIIFFVDFLLTPVVEHYTKTPHDLSALNFIKGDFLNLLLFTLFMWVVAAFGEEIFYRGYIMKRLAALFGGSNNAWIAGAVLSSAAFGIAHFYQGISGVISTGTVGFILAMAFYFNRNNLVICMLTHGIYDMFGLSMIYFDKETVIADTAHHFLFSIIY
jgi:membrane protease YdiL (CAAX protease family)